MRIEVVGNPLPHLVVVFVRRIGANLQHVGVTGGTAAVLWPTASLGFFVSSVAFIRSNTTDAQLQFSGYEAFPAATP